MLLFTINCTILGLFMYCYKSPTFLPDNEIEEWSDRRLMNTKGMKPRSITSPVYKEWCLKHGVCE